MQAGGEFRHALRGTPHVGVLPTPGRRRSGFARRDDVFGEHGRFLLGRLVAVHVELFLDFVHKEVAHERDGNGLQDAGIRRSPFVLEECAISGHGCHVRAAAIAIFVVVIFVAIGFFSIHACRSFGTVHFAVRIFTTTILVFPFFSLFFRRRRRRTFVQHALFHFGSKEQLVQLFGPYDTVNGCRRRRPDGANGIDLAGFLRLTLVTGRLGRFVNGGDLAQVARGAGFNEGRVGGQGQAIDATAGHDVVERVQNEIKPLDVLHVELAVVADVAVVRRVVGAAGDGQFRRHLARHDALGLSNVVTAKEELTIQIGDVNGVEIDHFNVTKPGEREIFQQLAANATRAHKE